MDPTDPIPEDDPMDLPSPEDQAIVDWRIIASHMRQEIRTRVERGDLRKAKIGELMGFYQCADIAMQMDVGAFNFRHMIDSDDTDEEGAYTND